LAEHWNLLTDLTLDHLDHLDHGRGYAVRGSFLRDLDAAMSGSVRRDCIGGFVVTQLYGLSRAMVDVDVIELAPRTAGKGTPYAPPLDRI